LQLTQISAQSFRNLSPEPVFFGSGVTLIVGENAQGKTNLLEAVAVLCGQRSFRRAKPFEMATQGDRFSVVGSWVKYGVTERLSVEWQAGTGRRFTRGQKAISFREASAIAPAVFLAPEDREILTGSPAARRRFLDRLVLGFHPAAGEDLLRYERVLASRNALLARPRDAALAAGELEAWTEELVRAGTAVRRHRREALEEWRRHFERLVNQAGPPYAGIGVGYAAREETSDQLRDALERVARAEQARGHTLAGPHRDELVWTRCGRPLAAQASAGELHRTAVLARLAEWYAVARAGGVKPLFAVDEFDAGLATGWVEAFLETLPPAETVLLTTVSDAMRWSRFADHVLEVRAGAITGRPLAVADSRKTMP
jgi:DNA replication and repair protein RecF